VFCGAVADSTATDADVPKRSLDDLVVQLRAWGTDTPHVLPPPSAPGGVELTIGAAEVSSIQLQDPSGQVSRLHARLVQAATPGHVPTWRLDDLASKNGLRLDGARCRAIELTAGDEIGIGGLTLIAESARSIALRGFLRRLLVWRTDRLAVVDHALRALRRAATRRSALVLCGDGDLVPIARAIHRRAFGADRPFIVCDPRLRAHEATVRSPTSYAAGLPAFAAATGGSLCARSLRLPHDFPRVVAALRAPSSPVRLLICAPTAAAFDRDRAVPITVPALGTRSEELDHIITEYADEAIAELDATRTGFLPADRDWVRMHAAASVPDLEKATRRLVAIRASRTVSAAAARLGMAPVSLSRWIGRRTLPMHVEP